MTVIVQVLSGNTKRGIPPSLLFSSSFSSVLIIYFIHTATQVFQVAATVFFGVSPSTGIADLVQKVNATVYSPSVTQVVILFLILSTFFLFSFYILYLNSFTVPDIRERVCTSLHSHSSECTFYKHILLLLRWYFWISLSLLWWHHRCECSLCYQQGYYSSLLATFSPLLPPFFFPLPSKPADIYLGFRMVCDNTEYCIVGMLSIVVSINEFFLSHESLLINSLEK